MPGAYRPRSIRVAAARRARGPGSVVLVMRMRRFASHLRRGPAVGLAIALGALLVLVGLPGDWGPSYGQTLPPCSIRPPVTLAVGQSGTGRLQVTVTATTNSSTPTNVIQSLAFGAATGGLIDIPNGQTGA